MARMSWERCPGSSFLPPFMGENNFPQPFPLDAGESWPGLVIGWYIRIRIPDPYNVFASQPLYNTVVWDPKQKPC